MALISIFLLVFSIFVDVDVLVIVIACIFTVAFFLIVKNPVGKSGGVFLVIFGLVQIVYGISLVFNYSPLSLLANVPRLIAGIIAIMAGFMHFETSDDLILSSAESK